MTTAAPAGAAPQPQGAAADGPGALSHFDLARKDCVGTARNRRSKVWFTLANGVLSDVYFPTIDTTNLAVDDLRRDRRPARGGRHRDAARTSSPPPSTAAWRTSSSAT